MSSVKGTPDHRYTFAYILNKPHATCLPTRMPVPLLSKDAIGTSNLARRRHQRAMRLQQDYPGFAASMRITKLWQTNPSWRLYPPIHNPIHMISQFRELRCGIVELLVHRRKAFPDGQRTIHTS
ncbi:hypothetical protein F4821DRAFT_264880 [Hypoxylon rubiginosum]|uniref:Uncharacterized protein n=1 Tax=Hypoxylon rubiginosum TaxID=110542 RepID=A0ACC0CM31_9PEZI|nr:hypothetical protein F4821DRAFT_264880 [Hypoxylon rubiginosum]